VALRSALGQGFFQYKGNTLFSNILRSAIHSGKSSDVIYCLSDVIRSAETSAA